jgi:tryptophan halogenase
MRMSAPGASPSPSRRVVVIGDGVAGWRVAGVLAAALGPAGSVSVVACPDGERDFPGADALLPSANPRLAFARDEDRLLVAAGGAFGWGIAYHGWAAPDRAWFLPFGSLGAGLGPVAFHQIVLRLRQEGRPVRLADYSLAALAAQAGRFARPGGDPRSVLSTCRYALHLDARRLAAALRERAEAAGVVRAQGSFAAAERAADGSIAAVRTGDGARLAADLFIDTSRAAVLTGDDGWEDWSAWLPCDHAAVARVPQGAPPPYVLAEAHAAGWTRHLPLADATVLVSSYRAAGGGEAAALASLRRATGRSRPEVTVSPVRFGRRQRPWCGNCVALGPAAALVDPLAVGNLHLLDRAVARLLELLPADAHMQASEREYNRRTAAELDNVRDLAAALYRTNGRHGEPFWDEVRAAVPPESLAYRMRLYRSRGKVVLYDEEPLEESSWISLFDEQGVRPERHHPMADGFPARDLDAHVARIRSIMIEELKRMPSHAEYLGRIRAAVTPAAAAKEAAP